MNTWPHQARGVHAALDAITRGKRRILLTCPTGGGKTLMLEMLATAFLEDRQPVVLYCNRKRLIEQLSNRMSDRGIYHGVRAAGFEDERDRPFQISSLQTEQARVLKSKRWQLHPAKLVLIDEAHMHKEATAQEIIRRHVEAGAVVIGVTATPIDLGGIYEELVVAGCNSELRECGAIVELRHYAPDEPDLTPVRADLEAGRDPSARKVSKLFNRPALFGRIWEHFNAINQDRRPTLCFGPDVAGSLWIAQEFNRRGVKAAHIDGENIWIDGETHRATRELWEELLRESRSGRLTALCNRFVLREGIDAPWLSHLVIACVFGELKTYVQSCGRILRSYPAKEFATCQDHGGNWHRFGSVNADRIWKLDYTSAMVAAERQDALREPNAKEPFLCPQCHRVWAGGILCAPASGGCGYQLNSRIRSRPVLTSEGELSLMEGKVYKPKRMYQAPDGPRKWERIFWAARSTTWDVTFRQAFGYFAIKHYSWPDKSWPFMPLLWKDQFRKVRDVAFDRLVPKEKTNA